MPSPIWLQGLDPVPEKIRNFIEILVGPAPENGVLLAKRDELLKEAEQVAVLPQQSPIQPADFVVLAVGVVIALLGSAGSPARIIGTPCDQQNARKVSLLFAETVTAV
jgi:hypothetical protein